MSLLDDDTPFPFGCALLAAKVVLEDEEEEDMGGAAPPLANLSAR